MIILDLSEYAINGILWLIIINLTIYTWDKITKRREP